MIPGKKFSALLPRVLLRVLPAVTVAMLMIGIATSIVVESSVRRQMQANLEKEVRFGADAVSSKLNAILSSARSVAANDLVINGLVDADAREAYVPLYFNQLKIAGPRVGGKVSFVDYRGRLIASNWSSQSYTDAAWLYRVIDNGREFVRIDGKGAFFVLPVIYQGKPEGALAIEFDKRQLAQIISISFGSNAVHVSTANSEIFSSSARFSNAFKRGQKTTEGWMQFTGPVPGFPDVHVTVAQPADIAFATAYKIEQALFVALILALIAVAAGIVSTAYLATNPLKRFVTELMSFGVAEDLTRRIESDGATEFQDLANSFNSMLERLRNVVVSHESLAEENNIRMRIEAALQEQNERFNVALENMSHGVCVFDNDSRLVVSNKRYATMYGLPPKFVIRGRTAREIAEQRVKNGIYAGDQPDDYVEERVGWGDDGDKNKVKIYELCDGRSIRVSRQLLSNGGWVTTHQDITEVKRIEQLKKEFVSVVSHELRTPLTSLSGSLRLLSAGAEASMSDEARSLVELADRNAKRLTLLVSDILDIEKIRSDTMSFNSVPVDVVALAQQAIDENAAYSNETGVALRLEQDVGEAYADIDENRIMQVLTNLLSNAAKFSSPNSEVALRVSRHDGKLRYSIVDTGCGIPSDKQPQLFEKFFQVDASDTRSRQGTGLGLAIVRSIVAKHGSRIRVDSEVGKGSTFYFDLAEVDAPSRTECAPKKMPKTAVA